MWDLQTAVQAVAVVAVASLLVPPLTQPRSTRRRCGGRFRAIGSCVVSGAWRQSADTSHPDRNSNGPTTSVGPLLLVCGVRV